MSGHNSVEEEEDINAKGGVQEALKEALVVEEEVKEAVQEADEEDLEYSMLDKEGQRKERRPNLSLRDRAKTKAIAKIESLVCGREKMKAWTEQEEEERKEFHNAGKKKG